MGAQPGIVLSPMGERGRGGPLGRDTSMINTPRTPTKSRNAWGGMPENRAEMRLGGRAIKSGFRRLVAGYLPSLITYWVGSGIWFINAVLLVSYRISEQWRLIQMAAGNLQRTAVASNSWRPRFKVMTN